MFEASDGTPIYIQNGVIFTDAAPTATDSAEQKGLTSLLHYSFCTPTSTPIGPHDWLTRTVIVGLGSGSNRITIQLLRDQVVSWMLFCLDLEFVFQVRIEFAIV